MEPQIKKLNPKIIGAIFGLFVAIILTIVTIVTCDSSCSESPVPLAVMFAYPTLILIGSLIGKTWQYGKKEVYQTVLAIILTIVILWGIVGLLDFIF